MRKQVGFLLAVLLFLLLATGCGSQQTPPTTPEQTPEINGFPMTIVDSLGREITIENEPEKIISLSPAITEILFAIGVEDKLVGVTDYCDYPPAALDKPRVGSFNSINLELIVNGEPDVIFMAAGIQADFVSHLEDLGIKVVALDANGISQVLANIRTAGAVTGAVAGSKELADALEQRINTIQEKVAQACHKPSVFFEVWDDPLMTAGPGSFVNDLILTAGGENVAADVGEEFAEFSLEILLERNPHIYIINNHAHKPQDIKKRPGYTGLKAVQENQVYAIEDDLVTLPGPRIVDGLEEMAKIIHPEVF